MDERQMQMLTEGLATKADKMRVLERNGVPRADIARFLSVRYQQVRNTLEGDKRTGYSPQLDSQAGRPLLFVEGEAFTVLELASDGSVTLDTELLQAIPGQANSQIFAIPIKHGLFITSIEGAMARLSEVLS